MLSLQTIGKRDNQARAQLRGREIEIRGLSYAEISAVEGVWPRPRGPLRPDPVKGDLAPPAEDFSDPAFRAELRAWSIRVDLLHFAVAVDWRTEAGESFLAAADKRAWGEQMIAELSEAGVTREEVEAVFAVIERLERGEDARKNS